MDGSQGCGKRADLLVINGDPLANIRVLLDKNCIETVIKDGKEVQFDGDFDRISWPHDRAQVFFGGRHHV